MALTDEVQNRFSTAFLRAITNPQNSSATTIDTTRLNNAIADTQALFKVYAGLAYDNTVDTHVATAVSVVVDLCKIYSGQLEYSAIEHSIVPRLEALGKITARDRITPSTDSLLSPTEDTNGDLPAFDRKNFKGYVPNSPNEPTTGTQGG